MANILTVIENTASYPERRGSHPPNCDCCRGTQTVRSNRAKYFKQGERLAELDLEGCRGATERGGGRVFCRPNCLVMGLDYAPSSRITICRSLPTTYCGAKIAPLSCHLLSTSTSHCKVSTSFK